MVTMHYIQRHDSNYNEDDVNKHTLKFTLPTSQEYLAQAAGGGTQKQIHFISFSLAGLQKTST